MTHLADDLKAARKLIERPECWTKGQAAKDVFGLVAYGEFDRAVCWCAVGAVDRICGRYLKRFNTAIAALKVQMPADPGLHQNIFRFNDDPATTHADILALFDRAIAAAEREG